MPQTSRLLTILPASPLMPNGAKLHSIAPLPCDRLKQALRTRNKPSLQHVYADRCARQACHSLNDPHICVLHDVGHQDGMDYPVMECVEGETLAKRLGRGSP